MQKTLSDGIFGVPTKSATMTGLKRQKTPLSGGCVFLQPIGCTFLCPKMSDGIYKTVTEADTASIPTYGQVLPAHGNGGCVGFSPIFPLIRQPEPSEPYPHIRFLLFYHRQRELSITAKKLPAVAGSFL